MAIMIRIPLAIIGHTSFCQGNHFQDYLVGLVHFMNEIQGTDIESADVNCIERYERLVEEHCHTFSALLAFIMFIGLQQAVQNVDDHHNERQVGKIPQLWPPFFAKIRPCKHGASCTSPMPWPLLSLRPAHCP